MKRIGFVIPSSNVVLEDTLRRHNEAWVDDVGIHIARLSVTAVDLGAESRRQFESDALNVAIYQLIETEVDRIVFAGTAGAWLGIDQERRWREVASERAGVDVTTTTLLTLDALAAAKVTSLGLVTPFTSEIHEAVSANLRAEGLDIICQSNSGMDSSREMAKVPLEQIADAIENCLESDVDAILCFCTNFRGYEAFELVSQPKPTKTLFDSVKLTLDAVGLNETHRESISD